MVKTGPDFDVIIVGAGPCGLALAAELGSRGVRCVIVERNDRVGLAPRAKTTNVRTRAHLRRWGIAERLAEAAPFGIDYPSDVIFVTRLAGHQLAKIENASNCAPARDERYPEHAQWVPQYKLEQTLRNYIQTLPSVTLRFGTEFASGREADGKVEATLRQGNGQAFVVSGLYLVGADGARSAVRDTIHARMEGRYGLSRNYNVVFRAPGLAQAHGHGPAAMYWQVNPVVPSLIGPMDRDDVWFFMPTKLPEGFKFEPAAAPDLISEATGIKLPYEILSSDEWVASSLIADRYRHGRIFLAGDACHLHPPFGGYGMNMGIADSVDLGWKLAAVIAGWGGPALLESYELERRGTHIAVIAEAEANHAVLSNDLWCDELDDNSEAGERARIEVRGRIIAAKEREFHTLRTVLGGCYRNSPIIIDDGTPLPVHEGLDYEPNGRPGCLAPHLWRADGRSIYDCFGQGFALVCRADVDTNVSRQAAADAAAMNFPLRCVRLEPGEGDSLYRYPFTLIRPDQYVAWRGGPWDRMCLTIASGWSETDVSDAWLKNINSSR